MSDLIVWFRAQLDEDAAAFRYNREADDPRDDWDSVPADVAAKRAVLAAYEEAVAYYGHDGPGRHAPAGEVTGLWTAIQHLAAGLRRPARLPRGVAPDPA